MNYWFTIFVLCAVAVSAQFDSIRDFCGHIPRISTAEFAVRRQRMSLLLAEHNIDAYVTEPSAGMTYFSGFRWGLSERPFLLIITPDGSSIITPQFESARAHEVVDGAMPIFGWEEHEYAYNLTREVVGGASPRIIVDAALRFFIYDGLYDVFDGNAAKGAELVDSLRMRKSPFEIDLMRCANEGSKAVHAIVSTMFEANMTESAVANLMLQGHREAGFTSPWCISLFDENAAFPHGTSNRILLEEGMMILIDSGGDIGGYQSDITRTYHFGDTGDRQREIWATVQKAQNEALATIRPGTLCSDADAAARSVIDDTGLGKYFSHRLGHGIGLEGHEEPYLVRGNDFPLEPYMTFSVEPGIYIEGDLGVRFEDIAMVTPTGVEVFGPLAVFDN